MTRPSLYEFAGGEEAFIALAAATHERCPQDRVGTALRMPRWSWEGLVTAADEKALSG